MPFSSQPGSVLTRPGNFQPGALGSAGTSATVTQPATWIGTIQTPAPSISAAAILAQPATFLTLAAPAPLISASVSIAEPATWFRLASAAPAITASAVLQEPATWITIAAAAPTIVSGVLPSSLRLHTVSDTVFAVHTVTDLIS